MNALTLSEIYLKIQAQKSMQFSKTSKKHYEISNQRPRQEESFLREVFLMIAAALVLYCSSGQWISANEHIASHGDWLVSYTEERKSVITTTSNSDRMVFGFVCVPASIPDCTIGAHLAAQCGEKSKEVDAKILIDNQFLTSWSTTCENAGDPSSGGSERVLLTSRLNGDKVGQLLQSMQSGRWLDVTVETSTNKTLQSRFSLSGYSKVSNAMIKVLGWGAGDSGGIGGNNGGNGSDSSKAKRDLDRKKWTF